MSDPRPWQKIVLRLLALALCLFSLKQSWAGVGMDRGKMAFGHKDYPHAVSVLERALKWDPKNPELLYWAGLASWTQGKKTNQLPWFSKSTRTFRKLTGELPYDGRGRLYLGLSRLAEERASRDGVTLSEWFEIKKLLLEALEKEPGSSWMASTVGTNLLSQNQFLVPEEREEAFRLLQKSVSIHRVGVASPYLKPVLSHLWQGFPLFKFLRDLTPRDYESYQVLLDFMDHRGLWEYREEIFSEFLTIRRERVNELCLSGQTGLEKNARASAARMFQRATWVDPTSSKAKAGLLASQEKRDPQPSEAAHTLQKILEDEDEELETLLPYLGPLVDRSRDPYLRGLYAVRRKAFPAARRALEEVSADRKFLRRYLALAYRQTQDKEMAARVLEPALLEKDPDLRDLLLLEKADPDLQTEIFQKIKSVATVSLPPTAWRGKNFKNGMLQPKEKAGVVVNIPPGKRVFRFRLRWVASEKGTGGYLIFRLRDRAAGSAYVDHEDWREHVIEVQTAGGKCWLEAESYRDGENEAVRAGAVSMGGVEIT